MVEGGLVSAAYRVGRDLLAWLVPKRTPPDEVVRLRQKWKGEIESHLRWIDDTVGYGEAIVRDVKRVDAYPNVDDKRKGISPWFRVGLLGTYHRGLQVGIRIEGLKYEQGEKGWRFCNFQAGEDKDVNAYVVGLIPFERIVTIDWQGDEYYGSPHVYCHFTSRRREPYEEVVLCEKRKLDRSVYYSEIAKYDQVARLSKKLARRRHA